LRREQPNPHTDWVLCLRDMRRKVRRVLLSLFLAPATIKKRKHSKPTKAHYPSNPKSFFNPKREVRKETPKPRDEAFVCMFCGSAGHLDEFYFRWKRIERGRVEYARDSYRDEFIDFLPRSYSHVPPRTYSHASSRTFSRASPRTFSRALSRTSSSASPQFAHGPNHRSYVLVHERTALSLDALVMAHVLIVVTVSRVGLVFPLDGPFPTLSQDTWMVHAFPIVFHIPLDQVMRCKRL
jgi:hypothetical protein